MCALHNHKIQWNARFMALCVLEEYAQDNNDASYISAAYSTACGVDHGMGSQITVYV